MSRTVVLTFDYEIFFVGPGTVERCLITPVDALLRVLDAIGVRACFFVDAPHLLRMNEEPGAAEDARRVNDQVGRIVAAGHSVELHVHPQWLDAAWQGNGTWGFSRYRSFVLGDLRREVVVDLMVSSADALTATARTASPGYVLQAFRAPGLCAQPFDSIAAGMDALGLTIDSSVAAGIMRDTELHSVDYRAAPREVCWRFNSDPIVPEPDGRFIELPITTTRVRPYTKVLCRLDRLLRPGAYRMFGDGTSMPARSPLWLRLLTATSPLSLEATSPAILRGALSGAGDLVTLVSHPKAMSPVSFEALRWLGMQDVRFLALGEAVAERCAGRPAVT